MRTALLLLLLAGPARAHEVRTAEAWRWSRFTTDSGLPSERVDCLVEDGDGTPWAGTHFGLVRYDGYRWVAADETLPEESPTSLVVQPDGQVLTVMAKRLFVGGRHGFTELHVDFDGLPIAPLQAFPLADGRLLVRADKSGLLLIWSAGGRSETLTPPEALQDLPGGRIWVVPDGDVYVNTVSGIQRYADGRWSRWIEADFHSLFELAEGPHGAGVAAVALPREGSGIWTWKGNEPPRRIESLTETGIRDVAVSPDGELTFVASADRVLFDAEEGSTLALPQTLRTARWLRYSSGGDLWIGANTGLFLYRRTSTVWESLTAPGLEPSRGIAEIAAARDGTLWVATTEGVERWRDGRLVDRITEAGGIALGQPTALAEDRRGRMWMGSGASFQGCLRWDGERWEHVTVADGLGAERVHKIRKDRRGRLWFLGLDPDARTRDGPGAFVLTEDDRFEHWSDELPNGRVYDFAEGPDGAYWFAAYGGISRFRDGEWSHWTTADGLQTNRVFTLAVDGSGTLWFGHQVWTGLGRIEHDVVSYDERGLPSEEVWELDVDRHDRLWIGTSNGICVQHGNVRISCADGTGLDRSTVWPILPVGDSVYFGTVDKGLVALRLGEVDLAPPRIVFDALRVEGRRGTARWVASSPDGWTPTEQVRTRYRFDDEPWSEWDLRREVQVPDEDTTLTVQALGFLGDYDPLGTTRVFRRTRSFYEQPLFVGPIALLSASVFLLVFALTARKRRHARELRSSEQRYRDLFENANDMIFTSDLSGRLHSANRKTREALALEHESVEGLRLEDLTTPDHAGRCREAHARVLAEGSSGIYELDLVTPGGREVSIELNTRLTGSPTSPTGMQSVARDVTGRREVEGERRHAHKLEALGVLAGGVAHDFNNVLSVILGYSDILIARAGDDTVQTRDLIEIRKAGERAASLTRQLLAFSRKQMQQVEVFELGELILDMEAMLRTLLGADVELVVERRVRDAMLRLDPGHVQQVVLNLAANARDAMSRGGRLSMAVDTVELTDEEARRHEGLSPGAYVELTVTDTGPGIDSETQRRIFDPFFTTKSKGKGTGLGLSSAYGIIQQSDGTISVRSAPGEGTTFLVLLPRTDEAQPVDDEREAVPCRGSETVLVVEDEDSVRAIMVHSLRAQGFTTFEAPDGHAAQQVARGLGGSIDLLVTDVVMPGMSGTELAERLTTAYPGLRVLYVSGYTDDALVRRGALNGIDVLQKPFGIDEFARKVHQSFGRPYVDTVASDRRGAPAPKT